MSTQKLYNVQKCKLCRTITFVCMLLCCISNNIKTISKYSFQYLKKKKLYKIVLIKLHFSFFFIKYNSPISGSYWYSHNKYKQSSLQIVKNKHFVSLSIYILHIVAYFFRKFYSIHCKKDLSIKSFLTLQSNLIVAPYALGMLLGKQYLFHGLCAIAIFNVSWFLQTAHSIFASISYR